MQLLQYLVRKRAGSAWYLSLGKAFVVSLLFTGAVLAQKLDEATLRELEHKMADLVNKDRDTRKLPHLEYSERLADVARAHSRDMVENGFFGHDSPRTGNQADRIFAAGIPCRASAENIVVDEDIHKGEITLMNSPGHRKNILTPNFTHIGIGIVPSKDGRICATQAFIEALEDIDGNEMRRRILVGVNSLRQKKGLTGLTVKASLEDAAEQAAKKFYQLQDLDKTVMADTLPQVKHRCKKRAILSFLASSADEVCSNEEFLGERWDSLGIGVVRNDTKAHGLGFFWIAVIIEDL